MGALEGKTAIITGAGRGIGRELAEEFGRQGARVAVCARSKDEIEAVAETIQADGGIARPIAVDVTSDASVDEVVGQVHDLLGAPDILVNNAGMHHVAAFEDQTMELWQQTVDLNLLGTVRMIKAVLPGMRERDYGRIVNIASTAGKYGSLYQSPYNASKHAVVGLTRCLALETAKHSIRVNAICPGFVETGLVDEATDRLAGILGADQQAARDALLARVPIGRFLRPDEISPLAVYLASEASDGMTGQALTISGGLILV